MTRSGLTKEEVLAEECRIMNLYAPHYRNNTLTNSLPYQVERAQFADWVHETVTADGISPANTLVLDVGCGAGEILELLSERGFDELSGIDAAPRIVEEARRNLPMAHIRLQNIEDFQVEELRIEGSGQGDDLPRIITAAFTVHHLLRPQSFFELIDRSLPAGGWFFLLEYNRDSWSRRTLAGALMNLPLIPLRAMLKLKNRRYLGHLDQVPALFNPAHRLLSFEEILAAMPSGKDYEIRRVTRGLCLPTLKHALSAASRFDRSLVRGVASAERKVLPEDAGHFQWVAAKRVDAG